jgi:hypothetical protein
MTARLVETVGVKNMQEDAPVCGRENDLIAFLYKELSETENKSFESHMHSCRVCLTQAQEFRSIRESVIAWRDESLGHSSVAAPQTSPLIHQPKGSALAALRAFFDLSPLWMKGAVGFAAVLFCVVSLLAVINLQKPAAITTVQLNNPSHSEQEINALVEQELARRNAVAALPPPASSSAPKVANNGTRRSRAVSNSGNELAAKSRSGKARRPLSRAEREQLAADLRLVLSGGENGLNLIGDQINQ